MATLVQFSSISGNAADQSSVIDGQADYYAGRAAKARAMAQAAIDPAIRDIHLAMAREYELKVEQSAVFSRPRPLRRV